MATGIIALLFIVLGTKAVLNVVFFSAESRRPGCLGKSTATSP